MARLFGALLIVLGAYLGYFYVTHQEVAYDKAKAKPTCLYIGIPAALLGLYLMKGGKLGLRKLTDKVPDKHLPLLFGLPGVFMLKRRQKERLEVPEGMNPRTMTDAELEAMARELLKRKREQSKKEEQVNGKTKSIRAL